ncbi:glycerophosphodiester phosphodiesterase [Parvibaculum sp.]|jgi:glycerophosphoryl diester phosphodiesterase|uniref:glycerophosphodiester phosphodiesterase n=1 Tax=Parvibaculum sp. TaxID=2024848 RepID=UPI000C6B90E5|nr:glycerophosphodiester phosphodiesterase [Parvibaculum sp.]MAM93783.1 glycerophosphodiester phosphodiesterase [Parvibaculum sp.]|tara:strand:- start:22972 stop:23748 length:777 start_codon:yes stop_codon:yes gene_type:complete
MRPAKFPYLEFDGLLAFAHRGGAGAWPENTMPAFQGAVDLGYRYIETDVHATRDGVLLAFHDDKLDRVTDMQGVIAEMDYAEVRKARIAGTEPIPLMAEVLSAWPDLRINIDPKRDNAARPLVQLLKDAKAVERVCINSFSGRRTAGIRDALGPNLCTGMGPLSTARLRFSSWAGPMGFVFGGFAEGCAQIPVNKYGIPLVDRKLVNRAHELGLQVHVWTIDDPDEMRRLIDVGVDGLMTDEPALMKTVLIERGLWPS